MDVKEKVLRMQIASQVEEVFNRFKEESEELRSKQAKAMRRALLIGAVIGILMIGGLYFLLACCS